MVIRIRVARAVFCITGIAATTSTWCQQPDQQNSAQQVVPQTQQSPQTATPDVIPQPPSRRIFLDVVVDSKKGPPVSGLSQQDFTLLDNNVPQSILSFKSMSSGDEPIEVILLVDSLNSYHDTVLFVREQIDAFLRENGSHLRYPTALAMLTDSGMKMQESFSTDGSALRASLDQYTIPPRVGAQRQSHIDYFQVSLEYLRDLAVRESKRPGRKIILWISPGWPFMTGPNVEIGLKEKEHLFGGAVGLSTALRQARITLYNIDPMGGGKDIRRPANHLAFLKGVTAPDEVLPGNLSLQVLATQTGGLAIYYSHDVAEYLQQCIADTQAYYEISFDPPPAEHRDEYHHLEVRIAQPGLTARTRQGYYGQP